MSIVTIQAICGAAQRILEAAGVPEGDAAIVGDTIGYAHLRGLHAHGIGRLPLYVKKIASGCMRPDTPLRLVRDAGATALFDAGDGFGQVAAYRAVQKGMEKARAFGVAMVGVRRSNNFGAAGYFGRMAAEEGLACMVFANSAPAVAPAGGHRPIFGTNPLCLALPGGGESHPLVLDMATTVAARGKIRLAARKGEKIPPGWALDEAGNPTDDPNAALKGTLMPIGGYKGAGLSMMIDALAGMMTGAFFGGDVLQLGDNSGPSGSGHLFVVMDPACFLGGEEYAGRFDRLVKNTRACGGEGRVRLPGDSYYDALARGDRTADLPDVQIAEIMDLGRSMGLDIAL
jgi:L-2-hydroxycarboxylate dehydrogenase (NAD+)